jgi:hypothetical protein
MPSPSLFVRSDIFACCPQHSSAGHTEDEYSGDVQERWLDSEDLDHEEFEEFNDEDLAFEDLDDEEGSHEEFEALNLDEADLNWLTELEAFPSGVELQTVKRPTGEGTTTPTA